MTALPYGGCATPIACALGGRPYAVIAAGGGGMGTPPGAAGVAFALPE